MARLLADLCTPAEIRTLAERFAQHRDVEREVAFFDERVGPDLAEQFFLTYDAAAVLDKECERLERLMGEIHRLAVL